MYTRPINLLYQYYIKFQKRDTRMTEANRETRKNSNSLSAIDQGGNSQEGGRASQKLLSPFTWSNIDVKLPTVNKKLVNPVIREETEIQDNKKPKIKPSIRVNKKLQFINKTIDVTMPRKKQFSNSDLIGLGRNVEKNNDRYRKQSYQIGNRSTNLNQNKKQSIVLQNSRAKRRKSNVLQKFMHKNVYIEQSPNRRKLNQTFQNFAKIKQVHNIIKFKYSQLVSYTFTYSKIQTYIYDGILKAEWVQNSGGDRVSLPQLAWSDTYIEGYNLSPNQIHNHIKNAHVLATKNPLYQMQTFHGSAFYPQSFLIPYEYESFCEVYEQQIIKICLRQIITNGSQIYDFPENSTLCPGVVLPEIISRENISQQSFKALRLCIYLQNYRRNKNYRYFEDFKDYVPIETRLLPSVLASLLKDCYQYWQCVVKSQNSNFTMPSSNIFDIYQIDQTILQILNSYHCLLFKYEQSYRNISHQNIWMVKPIASSRGTGITLLKNSPEFFTLNHERYGIPNKIKYNNKIFQKYIDQPLLLRFMKPYADRKFDIRQWVLISYDKLSCQPLIYIYEDAYCRFSDAKYSSSEKFNGEYSILLLSQIFDQQLPALREKYDDQISKIAIETILSAKEIKFQPNRFQLLAYDVIFDQNHKLWLLEININPACDSTRNSKLENMADKMVGDMLHIVRAASYKSIIHTDQRNGWKLVLGQQNFKQVEFPEVTVEPKVKPYSSVSLGRDSLIQLVRKRNLMMKVLTKYVKRCSLREAWYSIHQWIAMMENIQNQEQNAQQNQQQNAKNEQKVGQNQQYIMGNGTHIKFISQIIYSNEETVQIQT